MMKDFSSMDGKSKGKTDKTLSVRLCMMIESSTKEAKGMRQIEDDFKICSASDFLRFAQGYGFLPLFKNQIPKFSVEEYTPLEL